MSIRPYRGVQPQIGPRAWVDESAVVIGRVALAEDVSLWPLVVARGDIHRIEIGARSNVQDGSVLHVVSDGPHAPGGWPLTVGADVTVGHKVILHGARVGDRCLIGMGSVVLDGAVIEEEVIVAAGSVVPPGKVLASRGLYLGNPARRVRTVEDSEIERLIATAAHYVALKELHRAG